MFYKFLGFFCKIKLFCHCLLYKVIDREVVCCFYLLSPSCDHGGNRGVHGRNWSGGQQHSSPSLWHHWKSCTRHLLAERRAATTCRLAAPHHRRRDSAPGQPLWVFLYGQQHEGRPDCYSILLENNTLILFQLLRVQVSDMAGYLCVAENKVGTVEKLFSLTVQGRKGAELKHLQVQLWAECAVQGHFRSGVASLNLQWESTTVPL